MLLTVPTAAIVIVSVLALICELVAVTVPNRIYRRWAAGAAMITGASSVGLLVGSHPLPATFILGLASLYRVINITKLIEERYPEKYLMKNVRLSALKLWLYQLVVGGLWLGWHYAHPLSTVTLERIYADSLLLVALVMLGLTILNLRSARVRAKSRRKLPTLSVLLPARNEDRQLSQCLASVVASDYQKLEIIALDDCSSDKSSEIIKGFARDGVRFIKGKTPSSRWLAKNQAYEALAAEATGEILLFMGVDIRLGPKSLNQAVSQMVGGNLTMLSIMPSRSSGSLLGALIQPLRYFWLLALPRWQVNRPPVLSSCWLIRRQTYLDLGGMAGLEHSVSPEQVLARSQVISGSYGFLVAGSTLDVQTAKTSRQQLATAIRTRYPALHRYIDRVLLVSLFELGYLLAPFVIVVLGLLGHFDKTATAVAGAAALCLVVVHGLISWQTDKRRLILSLIALPGLIIAEFILLNISMYRYEFSTVNWKGRNICLPLLQSIPKLPGA